MRVGVDQTRHDELAGEIESFLSPSRQQTPPASDNPPVDDTEVNTLDTRG
jgi:hypothetical protein